MARKIHYQENPLSLRQHGKQDQAIEYPGNLPVFDKFGGCGTHPLFKLLQTPPSGYSFIHSEDAVSDPSLTEIRSYALRFAFDCWKKGASLKSIYKFIKTRDLGSQKLIGRRNTPLVFFPSVPFHLNQFPWVVEIEDSTSLFFPFVSNGSTKNLRPVSQAKYFPIYREIFHSSHCRGIITHVKSTAESLPILFDSPALAKKIFHIPLGIIPPGWDGVMKLKKEKKDEILILFTNSWHQDSTNFYLRGGLEVLEAFAAVKSKCPSAKLLIRSEIPRDLAQRYPRHHEIIRGPGVEVLDHFLERHDWERLRAQADYFILPSARIHVVSILEAMAYGMTLITSNGWGIEEYARNDHNAVVVPGRDRVTWMDWDTGILREDYPLMYKTDQEIAGAMAKAILDLNANRPLKDKLTLQARADVEQIFTVRNWNDKLKSALDFMTSGATT